MFRVSREILVLVTITKFLLFLDRNEFVEKEIVAIYPNLRFQHKMSIIYQCNIAKFGRKLLVFYFWCLNFIKNLLILYFFSKYFFISGVLLALFSKFSKRRIPFYSVFLSQMTKKVQRFFSSNSDFSFTNGEFQDC